MEEVKLNVGDVAREALESAGGDVQKAAAIMTHRVRRDEALYRELMDGMVDTACYEAVSALVRKARAAVWMPPNYDAGGNGERVRVLAAGNALMFFPLPGGKLLGQATRGEIKEAAAFYEKQAADMGHKARWLALVAKQLDDKKTVASCMTEKQLEQLQEKASHE